MDTNKTQSAKAQNENDLHAEKVEVGFHPDGYRIDKTTSPMNRYTKWTVDANGEWNNPKPVCFHSMPETGWQKAEHFDWDTTAGDDHGEN